MYRFQNEISRTIFYLTDFIDRYKNAEKNKHKINEGIPLKIGSVMART